MLIDVCTTIEDQTIVLNLYNSLLLKGAIRAADPHKRIEYLSTEFKAQLRRIGDDDNYELEPALMKSAFIFAMFAKHFAMTRVLNTDIYQRTYRMIIGKPLDLGRNRTFLGNLRTIPLKLCHCNGIENGIVIISYVILWSFQRIASFYWWNRALVRPIEIELKWTKSSNICE